MTLRRASLALSTLLLLGAVAACGQTPEKKPAAAPSTGAPSPSAVKLTDPEMFAMATKALLPEDALAEISFPGPSKPASVEMTQALLANCHPGLSSENLITGRATRIWPLTKGQWAMSSAFGFQETTAAQVIDEIRRTIPEKCRDWKATTPNVDRSSDYSSDVVLPELPGISASYGYCETLTFLPSRDQKSACVVFIGRKAAGMDMVASFHFSVENEAIAKAAVAQIAPKVAERLLKV
ncbi:hypothetical protein AB0M43_25295 [Longispora sp. NPDC051575]|uniref:hypothetical protein n=1 Tax=Longispora sp. NPDC051575 TaxID=3154943 RepID=UPI0034133C99